MSHFWTNSWQSQQIVIIIRYFWVKFLKQYVCCSFDIFSFLVMKANFWYPLIDFLFRSIPDNFNTKILMFHEVFQSTESNFIFSLARHHQTNQGMVIFLFFSHFWVYNNFTTHSVNWSLFLLSHFFNAVPHGFPVTYFIRKFETFFCFFHNK